MYALERQQFLKFCVIADIYTYMKSSAYIFLIGLVFCLLFTPDTSAVHQCSYCFKPIQGQSLEVEGKFYHPEHFICANCRAPITEPNFYERDGKYYDSTCFANFISKKCDYCGKPILGEAVYLNSKTYHTECYKNHAGMRCVVCGNVVSMSFFVDKKGNAVCAKHKDIALSCFSCQRFMSPDIDVDGRRYDDDRVMCNECIATAVNDVDDANDIIKDIVWQLEMSGIEIDPDYELSFVSLEELNKNFDKYMVDHLGVTLYEKKEYLGGLFSSKHYAINVLYGLPEAQLREVLAHELMHVWLFKHAPQPQQPQLCEGSCQYAAYLILQNDTTKDGQYFLEQLVNQDDSVYGLGFQNVQKYVNENGTEYWLEYLKKNKETPW